MFTVTTYDTGGIYSDHTASGDGESKLWAVYRTARRNKKIRHVGSPLGVYQSLPEAINCVEKTLIERDGKHPDWRVDDHEESPRLLCGDLCVDTYETRW